MHRSEAILYQMIPRKVTKQLQNGATCPAEYFEDVTVCFSDIVGFTKMASKLTPIQVSYSMLDERRQGGGNEERLDKAYGLTKGFALQNIDSSASAPLTF